MKNTIKTTSNTLSTFNFNSNEISVVTIDGQPWFVAKDVLDTLEYPKGSRTYRMKMLGETELGVSLIKTPKGGNQSNQIVSESGC